MSHLQIRQHRSRHLCSRCVCVYLSTIHPLHLSASLPFCLVCASASLSLPPPSLNCSLKSNSWQAFSPPVPVCVYHPASPSSLTHWQVFLMSSLKLLFLCGCQIDIVHTFMGAQFCVLWTYFPDSQNMFSGRSNSMDSKLPVKNCIILSSKKIPITFFSGSSLVKPAKHFELLPLW